MYQNRKQTNDVNGDRGYDKGLNGSVGEKGRLDMDFGQDSNAACMF